jgi:signal transduction histidine kinase
MSDFNSSNLSGQSLEEQIHAVQQISRKMLEMAHSGLPRFEFFRNAMGLVLEVTECSVVRMLIRDHHRSVFIERKSGNADEGRLEVTRNDPANKVEFLWTASGNESMEKLCRKLVGSHVDATKPWFTESGSFWIEDVETFPEVSLRESRDNGWPGIYVSPDCRSTMIVPVSGTHRRLGLLQMESHRPGFFTQRNVERFEPLAQTLGYSVDLRDIRVALRERVKELTCLYGIARLVAHAELSLEEILQSAVELLPPGWLYPEDAAARVVLDVRSFVTAGVDDIVQKMSSDIVIDGQIRGYVEVGYMVEKPQIEEGPFLLEESHLLDTVARELAFAIEQKSYLEEKRKLQGQLRHADRLATIGQLAAGVAHELNEPLSNIVGFAQLAASESDISEKTRRDINKIVSSALHAGEIIKGLLVFARETSPVKIPFNLNELIEDGLFMLDSRFVKAGINLRCDLDRSLPDITADRSQMLQVLTNLVVNSVQAMPDGGSLTIRTSHDIQNILLIIEDTGAGMDKKTLENIFHPFFTTKDVSEGTGLGLSVVHGIVAAHRGEINVESQPGKGSLFAIRLPINPVEES